MKMDETFLGDNVSGDVVVFVQEMSKFLYIFVFLRQLRGDL